MIEQDFIRCKMQLLKLAEADPQINALWLYGSHAKGLAHEYSDLDLAVQFTSHETDIFTRRMRPEMLLLDWQQSLQLGDGQLSVIDLMQAPILLGIEVIQANTLWYCRERGLMLQGVGKIMSRYEIDYLHEEKRQQERATAAEDTWTIT
ncbi:nucleotidyltransferase domain-containing protein [Marinomonas sp. M1K-6]|uniref:Nucleotidyltransferase domain-containing protein n=1 Tax=Marinomonas profundi TaxID=2726122 RepID=A0A847QZZ3_9GAMM|nr:nucleotidyltransferase domain-containing protein [Marinomonas profundi]NLQ19069.1 nucleotidyltransferase domain-containing protein [Marinomonas profundi]UDV04214.1 nucleotidyltransferase domain-containing protein [Marinomonas profundi]